MEFTIVIAGTAPDPESPVSAKDALEMELAQVARDFVSRLEQLEGVKVNRALLGSGHLLGGSLNLQDEKPVEAPAPKASDL